MPDRFLSPLRLLGLVVALALATTTNPAIAAEYEDLPKQFFDLVAKGDMGAAVDYVGGNGLPVDPDHVTELRRRVVKILAAYGSYAFHEKFARRRSGLATSSRPTSSVTSMAPSR